MLVERRRQKRKLGRPHQLPGAHMQARHHTGQKDKPRRIHVPAVAAREALDDRLAQLFRRGGVAEDAMLEARVHGREHRARRAKVRIGNPQRDDVAAGVAVPAQAPGAGALDGGVEIYFFWGFDSSSFSRLSWSCSSSGVALYGSSSRRFMLSSTSSVVVARASACSRCGKLVAMAGTNITMAMAMHCSTMNWNMPR